VLTVQVPSQFFYEYLEDKYLDLIQKTLYREIGEGTILNYRILVETESNTAVELRGDSKPFTTADKNRSGKVSAKVPSPFDRVETSEFDSQINTKYTFHNFFEGESNRLARTAAEAVANNPAKTAFNPLFVYGNSGVGKTHLCHAIGSRVESLYPDKKYCTSPLISLRFNLPMPADSIRSTILSIFTRALMCLLSMIFMNYRGWKKRRTPSFIYSTTCIRIINSW